MSIYRLSATGIVPMQALTQQLSGLSLYSPRPPDGPFPGMYNGLVPAAPAVHSNALLEGMQPPEAGYVAQPLIPNVHAMHAAAMQQVCASLSAILKQLWRLPCASDRVDAEESSLCLH